MAPVTYTLLVLFVNALEVQEIGAKTTWSGTPSALPLSPLGGFRTQNPFTEPLTNQAVRITFPIASQSLIGVRAFRVPAGAGGMPCTPHDCWVFGLSVIILYGHTNASLMIAGGADVVTLAGRLGHADKNVALNMYAHMIKSREKQVANKMDQFYAATANGLQNDVICSD